MKNPYFDSTHLVTHRAKLNFSIHFWVPHVPAAITGSPTGVEFKLPEIVTRHLYKYVGVKFLGKEFISRFGRYLVIFPN